MKKYDIIIVGGGHGGIEAACAAAKVKIGGDNCKILLITMYENDIGALSCNPSIGGVGKSTIVAEIDALDGLMALVADKSAIHYRLLNSSKGYAVQSPRVQIDRDSYKLHMRDALDKIPNLTLYFDEVEKLIVEGDAIVGLHTKNGGVFSAQKVIIATGTFLGSMIHIGSKSFSSGRVGSAASNALSDSIKEIGLTINRLKTGTPPRLARDSINFDILTPQPTDARPIMMSYLTEDIQMQQTTCYITHTCAKTHQIIRDHLHLSPLNNGSVGANGPRYCPSIEEKIKRFPDQEQHQIFLEPEGINSNVIYPAGISTSLPEEIQLKLIRSIKGLENAVITQFGYTVEYNHVDPTELKHTLETKKIAGLYMVGQINGTTGYEEAAGQGLVAGLNAALSIIGEEFILGRHESAIGVMIDDLVTKGIAKPHNEPYRMFTSRMEYRMQIRPSNADIRLTQKIIALSAIGDRRMQYFTNKFTLLEQARNLLTNLNITPSKLKMDYGIAIKQDGDKKTAYELLAHPLVGSEMVLTIWHNDLKVIQPKILELMIIESTCSNYFKKSEQDLSLFNNSDPLTVPNDIDYKLIDELSNELKQKLNIIKPNTILEVKKISGMTPAAVVSIIKYIKTNQLQVCNE